LPGANTLAYYENLSIKDVKSFIALAPGLDFTRIQTLGLLLENDDRWMLLWFRIRQRSLLGSLWLLERTVVAVVAVAAVAAVVELLGWLSLLAVVLLSML
jgi:hypothetical protein